MIQTQAYLFLCTLPAHHNKRRSTTPERTRALSFAAVLAAHRLGAARLDDDGSLDSADGAAASAAETVKAAVTSAASSVTQKVASATGVSAGAGAAAPEPGLALSMVPLDKLDLQRMSII